MSVEAGEQKIIDAVKESGRYPFLFIGSGLSRRYLGTPGWVDLLKSVCMEVLEDSFAYPRYLSDARLAVEHGRAASELPMIASLMEADVNRAILSSDSCKEFRSVNANKLQEGISPLRLYVSSKFAEIKISSLQEEARLLSSVGKDKISGVITTNYDNLCETLFPEFVPYIGEEELIFRDPTYAQEIYEIHGSAAKPESIVLTDADYKKFSERENYLAAKLLTIFLEYPVIFIGYSIQDTNIRSILASIARCVGQKSLERLENRLIFIKWTNGLTPTVGKQILDFGGQSVPFTTIETGDFSPIYAALDKTEKLYDVKALRQLRGSIVSIVRKLDAKSQVIVAGIDKTIDSLSDTDRIVIGFGQENSGLGKNLHLNDIYQDILFDDQRLPAKLVATEYLEDMLKHNSNAVPIFKYLYDSEIDPSDYSSLGTRVFNYDRSTTGIDSFLPSVPMKQKKVAYRKRHTGLTVGRLIDLEGRDRAFQFVKYLNETELDPDELRTYLTSMLCREDGSISLEMLTVDSYKSEFRKCIRIYDFMRYKYAKSPGLC